MTKRIFGKTSGRSRLYYWIDAALLGGIVTIIVTGLVISTWLNLPLEAYTTWRTIHVGASLLTLLLTVVKLGLHWRWIVSVAKSIFTRPGAQPQTAITTAIPVTATGQPPRVQPCDGRGRYQFSRGPRPGDQMPIAMEETVSATSNAIPPIPSWLLHYPAFQRVHRTTVRQHFARGGAHSLAAAAAIPTRITTAAATWAKALDRSFSLYNYLNICST